MSGGGASSHLQSQMGQSKGNLKMQLMSLEWGGTTFKPADMAEISNGRATFADGFGKGGGGIEMG